MEMINHPAEGLIPRWNTHRWEDGSVTLFENDEDGVRQQFTIPADQLTDVLAVLGEVS